MKFTRNTKRKTIRKSRRIRKSRKSNRKKTRSRGRVRKGGFFSLGINEKIFKNWKRKFPMKNDCCPCVFSFLGLPDYEVLQLKAQFQNWSKGMDVVDIENVFKSTNSDYDFKFGKSNQNLSGPDRKKKLDTAMSLAQKKYSQRCSNGWWDSMVRWKYSILYVSNFRIFTMGGTTLLSYRK